MASIESTKKVKHTLSDLKTLGHQLLSSRSHINNLPILLTYVNPTSPSPYVLESLLSLQSFFLPILPDLPPSTVDRSKSKDDDYEFIYWAWLHSKFHYFVNSLIDVYVSPHPVDTLKEVVLDTIMELVKLGNAGGFNSAIYHRLLSTIVYSASQAGFLVDLLASKYFKYLDVRYFTCKSLGRIARKLKKMHFSDDGVACADGAHDSLPGSSVEHAICNIHNAISCVPPLEGLDSISDFELWSCSGFISRGSDQKQPSRDLELDDNKPKTEKQNSNVLSSANIVKNMRSEFTKAWISYLRIPLPLDVYKEVLVSLHQAVIPHLSKPIMLCDFLTKSYDIGGVVSVMALSSLYVLMTQYGLEYPNFFEKLYALLVPSIFMAKHRAKFFQLLDSCLKSPLLPAYLAASFAKRLSRLLLSVSPSAALVITALIHNLLRRHPSINCLVHREDGDEVGTNDYGTDELLAANLDSSKTGAMLCQKAGIDYYDNEEANPKKSNATSSSLWEIDTIRHHYCPPVSRFVLSLDNDLTVRAKTSEISVKDFSSGSYATVFGEEMRRRVKQVPLAFYKAIPSSLFSDTDLAGWTFALEHYQETIHGDRKNATRDLSEHNQSSAKRQRKEGP